MKLKELILELSEQKRLDEFGYLNLSSFEQRNDITKNFEIEISPLCTKSARKNTLSSRYGLAAFPLHSDGANMPIPPKYVAIQFCGPSSHLVDFNILDCSPLFKTDLFLNNRSELLFSVNSGKSKYITRIFKNEIFRFNPCIMTPLNNISKSFLKKMEEIYKDQLIFNPKDQEIIIIDNYRCLHSRGIVRESLISERYIKRTWFYKEPNV